MDRHAVAQQLVRAGELGAFDRDATQSRWFGARVRNVQETESAAELVQELAATLHTTRRAVDTAAAQAGLRPARTVAGWREHADLYERVARCLETFTPEVFAQDLSQLVAATASSGWRRQNMVEMSSVARSRVRRQAKDVVRPGVQPHDLHAALLEAAAPGRDGRPPAGSPAATPRAWDVVAGWIDAGRGLALRGVRPAELLRTWDRLGLDPALAAPLPAHIHQHHFVGGRDENVPPALVRRVTARQPRASAASTTARPSSSAAPVSSAVSGPAGINVKVLCLPARACALPAKKSTEAASSKA